VSEDPGRQPRWKPLLKLENSAKNHLNIIFSETAGPIGPKLWWNGLQMVLFVFDDPGRKPRWLPLLKIENLAKNHLKDSLSDFLPNFLFFVTAAILVCGRDRRTQRGPSEDHSTIVWAQLAQQFQRR
jgi:hypothetical protein